jgi:hypothetical protein
MDLYSIKIGDIITLDMGLQIANQIGLLYLVERIEAQPEEYKDFVFDGCSFVPDELMGLFTGCDWKDITYLCCLPHDIGYCYGDPGNEEEKRMVDYLFLNNLINKAKMKPWLARVFLEAVKIGGRKEFKIENVSWGFGSKWET